MIIKSGNWYYQLFLLQKENIEETTNVLNATKNKLRTFSDDLISLINEVTDENDMNLDEYKEAKKHMDSAVEIFNSLSE